MAKILVADDNSNIQKMVGLALKDQGIEVVAVGNGEAAVRKISDLKPDLVLADVFMPVRNGYEVCKYVKDDPALHHIPVILLVGAFDPLDEQEAQRVGADGVLKKPFVPPDPLISMVKSALARAGVALGSNPPAGQKIPEPAKRSAAELLSPAASKLAELTAATKFSEPEPEPFVENFATLPEQVKIPEGDKPLAFGSLLETPETEDDAAFIPTKPPTELGSAKNDWAKDSAGDEEVEEEEESGGNGWRPGGDLDSPSLTAVEETTEGSHVADWREAAFHGSSPSKLGKSHGWAPSVEEPVHAEAASAVGVTTLEATKPVEAEVPAFSGDAWAAAMAAGVEEKTAEAQESLSATVPAVEEHSAEQIHTDTVPKPSSLPDNGWYSVSASPWELEARKATQLAATWDSAIAEAPAPDSPEQVSASSTAEAIAPHEQKEIRDVVQEVLIEPRSEEHVSLDAQVAESTKVSPEATATAFSQQVDESSIEHAGKSVNDTQEIEALHPAETKSWESTWVTAPAEVVHQFVEAPRQEFAEAEQPKEAVEASLAQETSHLDALGATEPVAQDVAQVVAAETVSAPEPTANMDELVARVLARMNPDMLQKMTRDLLKPVIEAILQDELNSKPN